MRLTGMFGSRSKGDKSDNRPTRAVVTFHTTCDAMAFDACAREHAIPGRLTTIPRQITAGCGYAWTAECAACGTDAETLRDALEAAILEHSLQHEAVHLL